MTSEGLVEIFKVILQTCVMQISAGVEGGQSGGLRMRRPKSGDPPSEPAEIITTHL